MSNPYKRLISLIPGDPLDTGEVVATSGDGVTVQLLSGEHVKVRGTANLGEHVYIRGGVIEGPAPDLPGVDIGV